MNDEQKAKIEKLLDAADGWIWTDVVEEEVDALSNLEDDGFRGMEIDEELARILIRIIKIRHDCDEDEVRTYHGEDGAWVKV